MKIAIVVAVVIVVAICAGAFFYYRSYKKHKETNKKLLAELRKNGIGVGNDLSKMPIPPSPKKPQTMKIEWWAFIKSAIPFVIYQESIMTPCIIAWKSKFQRGGHLVVFRRAQNAMAEGFYGSIYSGYKKLKPEELEKPLTGRVSVYADNEDAFKILFETNFAPTFLQLKNMDSLCYAAGTVYLGVKPEAVTGVNSVKSLARVVDALENSLDKPIKCVDGSDVESAPDEIVGVSFHNIPEKKEYYGKLLVDSGKIVYVSAWRDSLTARVSPSVYVPMGDTAELDPRTAEFKFEFPAGEIKKASLNKNLIMKAIGYILKIETAQGASEFQAMPESSVRLKDVLVRHGYLKS